MPNFMMGDVLWAGSERSLVQAQEAAKQVAEKMAAGGYDSDEDAGADMLTREGRTGIITIKGPLVNSDNPIYAYFGIPTYPRIRAALLEAALDHGIDQILLDIDSGGGAVSGVSDTGDLISLVDKNIKPIYSYTDGDMCSAAYWIGCAARQVFAAKTASVGSIGVITSLLEFSKQLEKEGVTPNIIRSGQYKQAGNPLEPLSDVNRAEIQTLIDGLASVFEGHVASCRSKSVSYTKSVMGQGRVFLAGTALEIGLIDKISNFDATFAAVSAEEIDIRRISNQNNGIGANMSNNNKTPLTAAVQAALIAAGHIPAKLDIDNSESELTTTAAAAATDATSASTDATSAATDATSAAVTTTEGTLTLEVETSADVQIVTQMQGEIALLKTQLSAAQDQLVEAKATNKVLSDQVAAEQASNAGLASIAVKSINSMQIALGGHASDFTGAKATDVLSTHDRVSADFKKNFKVGGVAAVDATPAGATKPIVNDSLRNAQLNAARL